MESAVGGFPINFGLEDGFQRMTVTEGNDVVHMVHKHPAKHAVGQKCLVNAFVYRSVGMLHCVEGLVMREM